MSALPQPSLLSGCIDINRESCSLLLQAGSSLTKVKLLVVDTTDPSRRTQVAPPASVASGSVYTSLYSKVVRVSFRVSDCLERFCTFQSIVCPS